jgi:hypothetical protein
MLDFASTCGSNRFGRHAVPRYGEAFHSLSRRNFNNGMDQVRRHLIIQLANSVENEWLMVANNDRRLSYRQQHS